jgi:hypothetical protein
MLPRHILYNPLHSDFLPPDFPLATAIMQQDSVTLLARLGEVLLLCSGLETLTFHHVLHVPRRFVVVLHTADDGQQLLKGLPIPQFDSRDNEVRFVL